MYVCVVSRPKTCFLSFHLSIHLPSHHNTCINVYTVKVTVYSLFYSVTTQAKKKTANIFWCLLKTWKVPPMHIPLFLVLPTLTNEIANTTPIKHFYTHMHSYGPKSHAKIAFVFFLPCGMLLFGKLNIIEFFSSWALWQIYSFSFLAWAAIIFVSSVLSVITIIMMIIMAILYQSLTSQTTIMAEKWATYIWISFGCSCRLLLHYKSTRITLL